MRVLTLLSILLLVAGCHSAPPRDDLYPAFYMNRQRLPDEMLQSLEHHRAAVLATPDDSERLIDYARSIADLAHEEIDQWLRTAMPSPEQVEPTTKQLQDESRMLQSCRHALALFHEAKLQGGMPSWQDRVTVAWFSIVTGNEDRAELLLTELASDPIVPDDAVSSLREVMECLPYLPSAR